MNFKTPFKVLTTAALIGTLSLSAVAPGAASAAEKTTVQSKSVKALAEYSVAQYILTKEGAASIILTAEEYEALYVDAAVSGKSFEELLNGYAATSVVTENDKVFTLENYEGAYVDAIVGEGDTTSEALLESLDKAGKGTDKPADLAKGEVGEDGKLVAGEPVAEEFEVTEVAAITTNVDKKGTLGFTVNGKEVSIADLKEKGYTVKFLATANVFADNSATSTTGVLDTTADKKFEYLVSVSKDGEEVAKSERVAVTTEDFAKAITEITSISTSVGTKEITSGKFATNEAITLKVLGKTKESGDKEVDITDNVKYTASPVSLISVADTGVVTQKGPKGEATVTVTSGTLKKAITLNVGNEARKADATKTTIDKSAVEVAANKTAKLVVDLKDQYGDAIIDGTPTAFTVENATDSTAVNGTPEVTVSEVKDEDGVAIPGKYEVTFAVSGKATKGNADVKYGTEKVGSVAVTVKEAGAIDKYELTTDKKEVDLKTNPTGTLATVALKAFDKDGLEASLTGKTIEYKIADANSKFVVGATTGEVTTKAGATLQVGDKVVVKAIEKEGAIETTRGEVEVKVVDSTPTLETVSFTQPSTVTEAKTIDLANIVKATAKGPKGDVKVAYTLAADGTVSIHEDNASGVVIGELKLAADEADAKFVLEDGKILVKVNGALKDEGLDKAAFTISATDKANNFKGEVTTNVAITTIDATNLVTDETPTVAGLKFFAKNVPASGPQTASTIAVINSTLDITINASNLELKDGKLVIKGELLSKEDWAKLKAAPTADKKIPYRITLANKDGNKTNYKIAFYADGSAVFELIEAVEDPA